MRRLGSLAAIVTCLVLPLQARQAGPVTEAEVRQWATEASVIAKGDVKKFNNEFENRAESRIRDYRPKGYQPFTLNRANRGLIVTLYGPVAAFQSSAAEMVRQIRPLAGATWYTRAVLTITTELMTAPRIERAVMKRGDTVIEPARNAIAETKARNLEGAVFDSREGSVEFSMDAFAPIKKSEIQIILIPESGKKNLEATLSTYALAGVRELSR